MKANVAYHRTKIRFKNATLMCEKRVEAEDTIREEAEEKGEEWRQHGRPLVSFQIVFREKNSGNQKVSGRL
ncbi:hypothetical protein B9Z55_011265 [Caenorhabditis nigoni]|uniref:Uncharacterized protein n=1 Tax=Caenorhabditis nigoni TaxID=1611254 RepID=A0A2G5UJB2_9PELO|nr:hypothetical protein B9Z55_011265 [Caenorhabditis nigoni]